MLIILRNVSIVPLEDEVRQYADIGGRWSRKTGTMMLADEVTYKDTLS